MPPHLHLTPCILNNTLTSAYRKVFSVRQCFLNSAGHSIYSLRGNRVNLIRCMIWAAVAVTDGVLYFYHRILISLLITAECFLVPLTFYWNYWLQVCDDVSWYNYWLRAEGLGTIWLPNSPLFSQSPKYINYSLPHNVASALKMEEECSYEKLEFTYKSTQSYYPEDQQQDSVSPSRRGTYTSKVQICLHWCHTHTIHLTVLLILYN